MFRLSFNKTLVLALLIATPLQFGYASEVTDLQNQLNQKQQELDANQSAADNKAAEAKTISGQISNLESDISTTKDKISQTKSQISSTQDQIDDLTGSIDQKNEELSELKKKLNNAIVEIYRFSSRSSMDLLFGGASLGLNTNQSNYVSAIEIQVKSMHKDVESVKSDLEKQKQAQMDKQNELNTLRANQEEYVKGAATQKSQKDQLLSMTNQQKSDYEAKVKKLQNEITYISADLYAARQRARGNEIISGGGSGYPYSAIDVPDAWGFLTRECTSYAAWYLNVVEGINFYNTRPGSGSAYNWPNLARDQGLTVSSSARVGAAISWGAGSLTSAWGHVAIVEKVNGDGTIDVSEYNWLRYSYSYRSNVNPGDYGSYSYIY